MSSLKPPLRCAQPWSSYLYIVLWKYNAVSEFNEFKPRLKSPKNRFQLSAGLNLKKINTILINLSRSLNIKGQTGYLR